MNKKRLFKIICTLILVTGLILPKLTFAARTQSSWLFDDIGGDIFPAQAPVNILVSGINRYINFGTFSGFNGYGIRDNNGVIEFKNSGGSWIGIGTGGSGGGGGGFLIYNNPQNSYSVATTSAQFVIGTGGTSTTTKQILEVHGGGYFSGNLGVGTTSPGTLLSVGNITGINFTEATSTFNSTGGINLVKGCFAIAGTCLSTSGTNYFTNVGGNTSLTTGTNLIVPNLVATGQGDFQSSLISPSLQDNSGINGLIDVGDYNGNIQGNFLEIDENHGFQYFTGGNLGLAGSTTPGTDLSIGNGVTNNVNISSTATSTLSHGVNILTGCYAIKGACTQQAIALTTTGTSGASTFDGKTLNIPQYTGGGGSGTVTTLTAGTNISFSSGSTCTTTCTISATGGAGSGTVNAGTTGQTGVWASNGTAISATSSNFINTDSTSLFSSAPNSAYDQASTSVATIEGAVNIAANLRSSVAMGLNLYNPASNGGSGVGIGMSDYNPTTVNGTGENPSEFNYVKDDGNFAVNTFWDVTVPGGPSVFNQKGTRTVMELKSTGNLDLQVPYVASTTNHSVDTSAGGLTVGGQGASIQNITGGDEGNDFSITKPYAPNTLGIDSSQNFPAFYYSATGLTGSFTRPFEFPTDLASIGSNPNLSGAGAGLSVFEINLNDASSSLSTPRFANGDSTVAIKNWSASPNNSGSGLCPEQMTVGGFQSSTTIDIGNDNSSCLVSVPDYSGAAGFAGDFGIIVNSSPNHQHDVVIGAPTTMIGQPGFDSANLASFDVDFIHRLTGSPKFVPDISDPEENLYVFNVSGITTVPSNGIAQYSNNGVRYTLASSALNGSAGNLAGIMTMIGTSSPQTSGTLTTTYNIADPSRISGASGDKTVSYSSFSTNTATSSWLWASVTDNRSGLFSANFGASTTVMSASTGLATTTISSATSTFAGGINLTGGCYASNGLCIPTGFSTTSAAYFLSVNQGNAFSTTSANFWGTSQGYLTANQTITLTGDVTGSGATSITTNVGKINGTALSGLATGLLKNTTTTGVPSIAVAGTDYLTGSGTSGHCVQWGASNSLGDAGSACGSGGSSWPFPLTGNATSTLTQFNGGLTAFASSTIGGGGTLNGLTVNGNATTTGDLNVGTGSTVGFYVDANGHNMTGGTSPTCGTSCVTVLGDDNTMIMTTGVSVSSATVTFASTWKNLAGTSISPVCIPTEGNGGTVAIDATTTPTTVTVSFLSALSTKNILIMCRGSLNATY